MRSIQKIAGFYKLFSIYFVYRAFARSISVTFLMIALPFLKSLMPIEPRSSFCSVIIHHAPQAWLLLTVWKRLDLCNSTISRSISLIYPTPARASNSAVLLPSAPSPIRATRARRILSCPSDCIPRYVTCLIYLSVIAVTFRSRTAARAGHVKIIDTRLFSSKQIVLRHRSSSECTIP